MGPSPDDLTAAPRQRPTGPTFAEYVPVVSSAVSDGTRKAYGSYWNRVVEQWGDRRLDEPTPSEIKQLVAYVKANVVPRRNARGGRSNPAAPVPVRQRSPMRAALDRLDIVPDDTGAVKMWMAGFYPTDESNTCLLSNRLSTMAFALLGHRR